MNILASLTQFIMFLAIVLAGFNLIIFVHELGHYLAARWRGLKIEKFQIWFGKPIWKKEINGVQYGLGWIPAGGFVALPQMAPMKTIEGDTSNSDPLPTITPIDKIIVAAAGPLFSLLLGIFAAIIVWAVGKPQDFIPSQIVGSVDPNSPAAVAGILPGDKITSINGKPINGFAGSLDSISESIILSKGKQLEFTVEREGNNTPLTLVSDFQTEKTQWYQRDGLRKVGIAPVSEHIVLVGIIKNSPAHKSGFQEGDILLSIDGQKFKQGEDAVAYIKSEGTKPMEFLVSRKGAQIELKAAPVLPISPPHNAPILGMAFYNKPAINQNIVHTSPLQQIKECTRMMWVTITRITSPDSSINITHLSGPVGIATIQYKLMQLDDGWRRILGFLVLFNINLAIMNMLPIPVLDGGHITLAIIEKVFRKPLHPKALEYIQVTCAMALISLMLFITSKDIGDQFGHGTKEEQQEVIFP